MFKIFRQIVVDGSFSDLAVELYFYLLSCRRHGEFDSIFAAINFLAEFRPELAKQVTHQYIENLLVLGTPVSEFKPAWQKNMTASVLAAVFF